MIHTDSTNNVYLKLSVWEKESIPNVKTEIMDFITHVLDFQNELGEKEIKGAAHILRLVRDMGTEKKGYVIPVNSSSISELTSVEHKLKLEEYHNKIQVLQEDQTALELEIIDNLLIKE